MLKRMMLLLTLSAAAAAAETPETPGGALGWTVSDFSGNYGLGVEAQTPAFFNGGSFVRVSAAYAWVPAVPDGELDERWLPLGLIRLGYFGVNWVEGAAVRGYGGGGLALALLSDRISSSSSKLGGYGLVGVELFLGGKVSAMYLELGGMGFSMRADRLPGNPNVLNGFLAGWGFRYYL
jgi:hypothetical protein